MTYNELTTSPDDGVQLQREPSPNHQFLFQIGEYIFFSICFDMSMFSFDYVFPEPEIQITFFKMETKARFLDTITFALRS